MFFKRFLLYLFLQVSRVWYSNFDAFQVWMLICYFYFLNKAYFLNKVDKFFFLNHCFHFFIYRRRLPIVKSFGSLGNKICHDICLFTPLLEKALSQLNWDMDLGLGYYLHFNSVRRLFHMEVDRIFSS